MQNQPKSLKQYVYSSEMKVREKLSLKNLLGQEPGLQRNYTSQQSYRNTTRPQTMYGQRVRMFLTDQNKKTKMQTEIKMRRQQSSYKVIKSNSGTQLRTVTQEDKIKMKKSLGRINVLAEGGTLQYDEEEQIQAIFHFISCLAQVDNHYQIAFQYLLKRLKMLVFADPNTPIGRDIKSLADSSKNQFLIKFAYRNLGKTTFGNLCKQLLKETAHSVEKMQQALKKQQSGEQKNLQVIKQKQELIKKLKRQLKYYQDHPSQDLYPYVKKLQRQNKQLKQQIQQLLHLKNENQYTIEIQQTSNLLLSEQIQSLKARLYEMELQELSGLKQIEKNSELKQFEENVDHLKDMLEKSKLKMTGMKEQFQKIKAQNEQLINQRSVLAKRAAVGFGQLTPRPNIKGIFSQNNLIYEDYINLSKKNTSTQNITKSLVKKIKVLEANQSRSSKNQQKKTVIQKFEKDDIQDQDIMQNTIDLIDQTKMQINKAEESAYQLKKSYNKQKQQKQSIQKNMGKK